MNRVDREFFLYGGISVLAGTLLALQWVWGAFVLSLLFLSLIVRKSPRILLCSFLIFLSYLNGLYQQNSRISTLSPDQTTFMITFTSIPSIDGNRFSSPVDTGGEAAALTYYLSSPSEKERFSSITPGTSCTVSGELKEPSGSGNPNLFDYKEYLYQQKTYWTLKVESFSTCVPSNSWSDKLVQVRAEGLKKIDRSFPPETVGVTQALLFGETAGIAEETMEAYRALGVVHLLAISGLHVGLISACVFFLLLRAGLRKERAGWVVIVFLLCYMVITGAAPSVVRASSMLIVILLGQKAFLGIKTIDSLSIIFSVMVFYDPYLLFHAGFQLSFFVSFSLVLSSNRILSSSSTLLQAFKVTFVSQVASLPFILHHFFEFSVIGFLTNLLYVPLYSLVILPAAFLLYATAAIGIHLPLAMELFQSLLGWTDRFSVFLASFPFSTLILGRPHPIVTAGYFVIIWVVFFLVEKGRWVKTTVVLVSFISLHLLWNAYRPYGEITFIDVGQGDAILIELPFNQGTYLIDTGGNLTFPQEEWEERKKAFSTGKDIVVPYLKSKGIQSVDKLILTHGDLDHVGGAVDVLEELNVKEVWISPGSGQKEVMADVMIAAGESAVREVKMGNAWLAGDSSFSVLSPDDAVYEGNDDSLVIYAHIGGMKWLFTGDLEEGGERKTIRRYNIVADVLKVGHHGSASSTSDEFLEAVNPQVAIISAGKDNRFGHPHPDVVERLKKKGVKIYNTADDGAVTYRFWRGSGTFSAHRP
ncbi:competence protein ComEC [Rossellomorea marisflavi]